MSDRDFHFVPELPPNSDNDVSVQNMFCRFEWHEFAFPGVWCCCYCVLL